MHIAQSLIVLCFVRVETVLTLLSITNVALVASIVLLEWHYVVDLLVGTAVAIIAVIIADRTSTRCGAKRAVQSAVTLSFDGVGPRCTKGDTLGRASMTAIRPVGGDRPKDGRNRPISWILGALLAPLELWHPGCSCMGGVGNDAERHKNHRGGRYE